MDAILENIKFPNSPKRRPKELVRLSKGINEQERRHEPA
jgi:hypothetical protein